MNTIRVAIVDDEELARLLLREYLSEHSDIEVVAECANGFDAVKAVAELKPDLLLLDIQMPGMDGMAVARALADRSSRPALWPSETKMSPLGASATALG